MGSHNKVYLFSDLDKNEGRKSQQGRKHSLPGRRKGSCEETPRQNSRNDQGFRHNDQGFRQNYQGLRLNDQGLRHNNQGLHHNNQGLRHNDQGLSHNNQGLCHNDQGLSHTINSGNLVSFQTLIGFFFKKSFCYGRPFFFSADVQNRGLGSGSL